MPLNGMQTAMATMIEGDAQLFFKQLVRGST